MDDRIGGFWDWVSMRWFYPTTFFDYSWENSLFLYFILAIPLLLSLRWLLNLKFRQKLPIALTKSELKWHPVSLLRFIPNILQALILAMILAALARPQRSNEKVERWSEGIDIMLVVDISQSMQIEDFKPNRLESAKEVAQNFISGRFQDRIGLVVFSGEAYSLSPLTADYELLSSYIQGISFDLIEVSGTAIGSALAVATNRMRDSKAQSKVLILLSDGDNNAGNLDPITSAKLAHAYGIKIYSIAIGKEGRVPFGKDFFGRPNYVENVLNESTLREVARIGEGQFYRVSNNKALEEVFARINKYEKSEIKETRYKDTTDFYPIYLKWAIFFFLLWLLLKSTFITNILQD